ncbi:50S ribosomal protein L18 [Candidatus Nitrospira salsa]|nr:MAG: 50S ribosomal protein L18 [Nitrospirales bacterium]
MNPIVKRQGLVRRRARVRQRVTGTPTRPRLSVFRSNNHIYAQIIDDESGKTLVSASTCDPGLRKDIQSGGNRQAAEKVGLLLVERAKAIPIQKVVFDRAGRMYHGRVKALADAARSGGLEF